MTRSHRRAESIDEQTTKPPSAQACDVRECFVSRCQGIAELITKRAEPSLSSPQASVQRFLPPERHGIDRTNVFGARIRPQINGVRQRFRV